MDSRTLGIAILGAVAAFCFAMVVILEAKREDRIKRLVTQCKTSTWRLFQRSISMSMFGTRTTKKQQVVTALSVLAAMVVAYNWSDWFAGAREWHQQRSEWRSENYSIATSKCYICFSNVDYWQKKGQSPKGAETICGNCGHANTYQGDTLPTGSHRQNKTERDVAAKRAAYGLLGPIRGFACKTCDKDIELIRNDKYPAVVASVWCTGCNQACAIMEAPDKDKLINLVESKADRPSGHQFVGAALFGRRSSEAKALGPGRQPPFRRISGFACKACREPVTLKCVTEVCMMLGDSKYHYENEWVNIAYNTPASSKAGRPFGASSSSDSSQYIYGYACKVCDTDVVLTRSLDAGVVARARCAGCRQTCSVTVNPNGTPYDKFQLVNLVHSPPGELLIRPLDESTEADHKCYIGCGMGCVEANRLRRAVAAKFSPNTQGYIERSSRNSPAFHKRFWEVMSILATSEVVSG